jgi:hypothetical protein
VTNWEFVTKPVRGTNTVSWEWEWRATGEDGSKITSRRTYPSFRDCVADAKLHGFDGEADPGESGTVFKRPEARFNWC